MEGGRWRLGLQVGYEAGPSRIKKPELTRRSRGSSTGNEVEIPVGGVGSPFNERWVVYYLARWIGMLLYVVDARQGGIAGQKRLTRGDAQYIWGMSGHVRLRRS